jgi:Domain of unknown function (DUF4180)
MKEEARVARQVTSKKEKSKVKISSHSEQTMTEPPNILVAVDSNIRLESAQDISNLIGACWGMDGVILHETDLASGFFDLRSGLLGELFQKCTNYDLRLALVVLEPAIHGERFSELVHEHRTHKMIRFFVSTDAANAWLRSE